MTQNDNTSHGESKFRIISDAIAITNLARYTKLTTEELKPLFEGLKGGVEPTDIILLTKQQQEVVKLVEERQYHWTNKCAENVPV
ncbi:hypothetical protein E2320_000100, partial [Naja naja]